MVVKHIIIVRHIYKWSLTELNQVNVGASTACTMDTLCLLGDGISYNDDTCATVSKGW